MLHIDQTTRKFMCKIARSTCTIRAHVSSWPGDLYFESAHTHSTLRSTL